jgi:hypothetical protein
MLIHQFEDILGDPWTYRSMALNENFQSIPLGPVGSYAPVEFKNMVTFKDWTLPRTIEHQFPGLKTTYNFLRQSPYRQEEPNFVHTDRTMGDWTAILYLNPNPPKGDGTTFWKNIVTGAIESKADTEVDKLAEGLSWVNLSQWIPWHRVVAKFNRMVMFPAPYFHSRSIYSNYGIKGDDARLVQIVFGTGTLPEVD